MILKMKALSAGLSSSISQIYPINYLAATAAYCLFIFYLSSIPSFPVPPLFPHFDKFVHFCLYACLSVLTTIGLRKADHAYSLRMLFILPVGFCIIYALSDETHQLFVDGRTFDVADLAADTIGAIIANLLILSKYQSRGQERKGDMI